jgi:peptidoglycan/xylan/chitin deacetylase (PgdA/CDA1 family)
VHAHPVLQQHGFTALCFLVSSWPGDGAARAHAQSGGELPELPGHREGTLAIEKGEADRAILRWSEIDAMRRAGTFEFHSHTHSHVRWDKVAPSREEKCAALRCDLLAARAALETRMGEASDHLFWPQGFYDDDYRQVARETRFKHFYTCEVAPNIGGERSGRTIDLSAGSAGPASVLACIEIMGA